MNQVKTFGNNVPVLVNGKCVLFYIRLNGKTNHMDVARKMFAKYSNCFANVAGAMETIRAYEKNGDFIWTEKAAYIIHAA